MTRAVSDMAVFEQSGALFSPLPFAIAAQIILSLGVSCAQLVNFIIRERRGGERHHLLVILFCSSQAEAKEANLDQVILECVFIFKPASLV